VFTNAPSIIFHEHSMNIKPTHHQQAINTLSPTGMLPIGATLLLFVVSSPHRSCYERQ
jgi:hypothetical protein